MMHWGNGFGMGAGFGWIFMILFWGLVILGGVYLVKILVGGSSSGNPSSKESSEEVLRRRFASGEITKEEFEEAIAVLNKHPIL